MKEYIEREALLELYADAPDMKFDMMSVPIPVVRQNILDMPAADVVERSSFGAVAQKYAKITDISANEPHLVCEVIDLKCHHRWIALYPEKTLLKQLECPNCGAVGFVIKTGQEVGHA